MEMMNFYYYYVYFIITVNTYLFRYLLVKLGFIILSIIGVLRIPEEFYLYKDKKTKETRIHCTSRNQDVKTHYEVSNNNLWRNIKMYIKQILYNFGMYSGLVRDINTFKSFHLNRGGY